MDLTVVASGARRIEGDAEGIAGCEISRVELAIIRRDRVGDRAVIRPGNGRADHDRDRGGTKRKIDDADR